MLARLVRDAAEHGDHARVVLLAGPGHVRQPRGLRELLDHVVGERLEVRRAEFDRERLRLVRVSVLDGGASGAEAEAEHGEQELREVHRLVHKRLRMEGVQGVDTRSPPMACA